MNTHNILTKSIRRQIRTIGTLSASSVFAMAFSFPAHADNSAKDFRIATQPLSQALLQFSEQTGLLVVAKGELLQNKQVSAINGEMLPGQALEVLLAGTGLDYRQAEDGSFTIVKKLDEDVEQSPEGSSDDDVDEEIVVTGSRIARTPSQVAANVKVITAEDIRATGATTLERALARLPQNMFGATNELAALGSFNKAVNISGASSVNLRGLGDESTLVLIDGHRIGHSGVFGGVSDISGIPLDSIDRIEILLDGASSIYGSDAVGGVVNVITKRNYEGGEIRYNYGKPQEGGFEEHIFSVSGGWAWGSGRLNATFEQKKTTNLAGPERSEGRSFESSSSPIGNISVGDFFVNQGTLFFRFNGVNFFGVDELAAQGLTPESPGVERVTFVGIPDNFDGSTDLTIGDITDTEENTSLSFFEGVSLIPQETRSSLTLRFGQDVPLLGEETRLSGDIYYSTKKTSPGDDSQNFSVNVPEGVSSNGLGQPIRVSFTTPYLPAQQFETDQKVMRGNLSLDGSIANNWRWNISAGHSEDVLDSIYNNVPLSRFSPTWETLFADGLNLFAADKQAANSRELLLRMLNPEPDLIQTTNSQDTFNVGASGNLFSLPGGDVYMAIGADWRKSKLTSFTTRDIADGPAGVIGDISPRGALDTDQKESSKGVFVEFLVPVFGSDNSLPGIEKLDLTGSVRRDSYDGAASSETESLGFIWSPESQILVKANYSTSFKTPLLRDSIADIVVTSFLDQFPGGFPFVTLFDENNQLPPGPRQFAPFPHFASGFIRGGNPDLKPETAESLTGIIEYRPDFVPGLMFSVTMRQTDYINRIQGTRVQLAWGPNYEAAFPEISRDENGFLFYDLRARNLASVNTAGRDYTISYNRDTEYGQFILNANVGYTGKQEKVERAGEPTQNLVKQTLNGLGFVIPAYRYQANLGWHHRGLSLNLDASTSSTTRSTQVFTLIDGLTITTTNKSALDVNLVAEYNTSEGDLLSVPDWLADTSVSLTVHNLLDDSFRRTTVSSVTGESEDLGLYSNFSTVRGRMFYLNVVKRF